MTRRKVPQGALLDPPGHGHDETEIALARAEDRIRTLELETRSLALDIRDLNTGLRHHSAEIAVIRSSVPRKPRISATRTTGERGGRGG